MTCIFDSNCFSTHFLSKESKKLKFCSFLTDCHNRVSLVLERAQMQFELRLDSDLSSRPRPQSGLDLVYRGGTPDGLLHGAHVTISFQSQIHCGLVIGPDFFPL
jgi:hypothetical protein